MIAPAPDVAVVHYNEIALKLGHRSMFVNRLLQNVREALDGLGVEAVRATGSRIDVVFGGADSRSGRASVGRDSGHREHSPCRVVPA